MNMSDDIINHEWRNVITPENLTIPVENSTFIPPPAILDNWHIQALPVNTYTTIIVTIVVCFIIIVILIITCYLCLIPSPSKLLMTYAQTVAAPLRVNAITEETPFQLPGGWD